MNFMETLYFYLPIKKCLLFEMVLTCVTLFSSWEGVETHLCLRKWVSMFIINPLPASGSSSSLLHANVHVWELLMLEGQFNILMNISFLFDWIVDVAFKLNELRMGSLWTNIYFRVLDVIDFCLQFYGSVKSSQV